MGRRRAGAAAAAFAVASVLAVAGCGVRPTGILSAGGGPVAHGQASTMTLYLVRGKRLAGVTRPGLAGHPYLPLTQLKKTVTAEERRKGLHTEVDDPFGFSMVAPGTTALAVPGLRFAGGRVVLGRGWSRTELAQLVCTAEAMPGVSTVQVSSWSGEGEAHTMRCDRFSDLLE